MIQPGNPELCGEIPPNMIALSADDYKHDILSLPPCKSTMLEAHSEVDRAELHSQRLIAEAGGRIVPMLV